MVLQNDIELRLPDGKSDAVVFRPHGEGKWPGVLYLTDIGGIRPAQRQGAERLSAEGYVVLLPNVFYRVAKPPVMDLPALRPNPDAFMKRLQELTAPLTPQAIASDARGYVNFLANDDSVGHKLGVVGFCYCGAFAMRVAATCPDQISAGASFHGGQLFVSGPDSPHLLLPMIKARLLFGHAVEDRSMPAEAIQGFEEALKTWGGQYESATYEGARHGWTTLDNPAFNAAQAARAFEKLKQLFAETLH